MKKISHLIGLLAALFLLVSCGSASHTEPGFKLSSVPEYAYIQPLSYIFLFDVDGGSYNEEYSDYVAGRINAHISAERYPFSEMIEADYAGKNEDAFQWMLTLDSIKPAEASRLRVPKSLIKLIEDSGHRYGVVIFSQGYVTTKEAYGQQIAKKAATRLLDAAIESLTGVRGLTNLGGGYYLTSPYAHDMYLTVIDAQKAEVVYFNRQVPSDEKHPTDEGDVSKLLRKLLADFR